MNMQKGPRNKEEEEEEEEDAAATVYGKTDAKEPKSKKRHSVTSSPLQKNYSSSAGVTTFLGARTKLSIA